MHNLYTKTIITSNGYIPKETFKAWFKLFMRKKTAQVCEWKIELICMLNLIYGLNKMASFEGLPYLIIPCVCNGNFPLSFCLFFCAVYLSILFKKKKKNQNICIKCRYKRQIKE